MSLAVGIDVNIKDNRSLTALDIVKELPSQKSQQIAALIEGKFFVFVYGEEVAVLIGYLLHKSVWLLLYDFSHMAISTRVGQLTLSY